MNTYLKYKPAWLQILIFGSIAFGVFLVMIFLGFLLMPAITGVSQVELMEAFSKNDFSSPASLKAMRWLLIMQSLGLFILPPLIFSYFADPYPMSYVGMKRPYRNYYFLLAILIMLAGYFTAAWLAEWNKRIVFPDFLKGMETWARAKEKELEIQTRAMLGARGMGNLFANIFIVSILAGIGEELFFRGIIQKLLIRLFRNPWTGIIIAAAIFSVFHMQFLGFFARMLLGVALGAMYWYSGSLWPAIIGHILFNGVQVVLAYFSPEAPDAAEKVNMTVLTLAGLAGAAVMIALIIFMKRKSPARFDDYLEKDTIGPDDQRIA